MLTKYTCPQTGATVIDQPAASHARLAFMWATGIARLQACLDADHWTNAERAQIAALIDGHKDSIVAHANAIISDTLH